MRKKGSASATFSRQSSTTCEFFSLTVKFLRRKLSQPELFRWNLSWNDIALQHFNRTKCQECQWFQAAHQSLINACSRDCLWIYFPDQQFWGMTKCICRELSTIGMERQNRRGDWFTEDQLTFSLLPHSIDCVMALRLFLSSFWWVLMRNLNDFFKYILFIGISWRNKRWIYWRRFYKDKSQGRLYPRWTMLLICFKLTAGQFSSRQIWCR